MTVTDNWTEAERDDFFDPTGEDSESAPPRDDNVNYATIFNAPDYASWVKRDRTARAKDYETRVNSMLKAATLAAFKRGNVTDGAALVHYGPDFARAAGDLTDVSDGAVKAIEMLTAPDNPWVLFLIAGLPLGLQLLRNHEREAGEVYKTSREARRERKRMKKEGLIPPSDRGTPITIRGPFGRKFTFRIHVPGPAAFVSVFRAQTREPRSLAREVLSDVKLQKALEKHGIKIIIQRDGD